MKNKDAISSIVNDLKGLNLDDRVSKRYILSKLRDRVAFYIKRENELLRLFNYRDIWTTVDCLEMVPADSVECCCINITKCDHFVKSKLPLPEILTYKGGPLIREVLSIDGSSEYKLTTPTGFKRILDREFKDDSIKYYWFENNHIIIPNSQTKVIRITAYFQDITEAKKLNSCSNEDNTCISPLEEEFLCPSHLVSLVKEDVLRDLFTFYTRKIEDENGNDDTNLKQGKNN